MVFKGSGVCSNLGGSITLPADPGHSVAANPGSGIYFNNAVPHHVLITGWKFTQCGYWFNTKPMDAFSISGAGIGTFGWDDLTISNCSFSRMNIACEMNAGFSPGATNLTIVANEFADTIVWGVDLPMGNVGAAVDNIFISQNKFHDYNQFDGANWSGYGDWPHTDGIFLRNDFTGVSYGTNINFFGNAFYCTSNTPTGGTASIYVTEGPNANIYNNIFYNDLKGRILYFFDGPRAGGTPQIIRVFNNSFYESFVNIVDIEDTGSGRPVQTFIYENNVHYDYDVSGNNNSRIVYIISANTAAYFFDYNDYKTLNPTGSFFQSATPSLVGGLAAMQGLGWEAHGHAVDPLYVFTSTIVVPTIDLHLQSGSPVLGQGLTVPLTSPDKDGVIRNPPWDLGAFQGGSILPQRLARITNLHVGKTKVGP